MPTEQPTVEPTVEPTVDPTQTDEGELALKGGVQTQSHFMYLRMYAAGYKFFNGVQWTRASRPISEVLSENFAPDSFWRPRGVGLLMRLTWVGLLISFIVLLGT